MSTKAYACVILLNSDQFGYYILVSILKHLNLTDLLIKMGSSSYIFFVVSSRRGIDRLYALSFMWMKEVATAITIGVSIIISLATGSYQLIFLISPFHINCANFDLFFKSVTEMIENSVGQSSTPKPQKFV